MGRIYMYDVLMAGGHEPNDIKYIPIEGLDATTIPTALVEMYDKILGRTGINDYPPNAIIDIVSNIWFENNEIIVPAGITVTIPMGIIDDKPAMISYTLQDDVHRKITEVDYLSGEHGNTFIFLVNDGTIKLCHENDYIVSDDYLENADLHQIQYQPNTNWMLKYNEETALWDNFYAVPIGYFCVDNQQIVCTHTFSKFDRDSMLRRMEEMESIIKKLSSASVGATDMVGATADVDGIPGVVTKPLKGDQNKVLRGSGKWDYMDDRYYTEDEINSKEDAIRNTIANNNNAINQAIENEVDTLNDRIDTEVENLTTTINNKETALNTTITNKETALKKSISDEVKTLNDRIDTEVDTLNDTITNKETALNTTITNKETALKKSISDEVKTLNDRIDTEVDTLNNTITTKETALNTTITNKENTLNDTIESEVGTLNSRIDTEVQTINQTITNLKMFSGVTVGGKTVGADSNSDSLALIGGTNVTITPDITNDTITFTSKDTKFTLEKSTPTEYSKENSGYKYSYDKLTLSLKDSDGGVASSFEISPNVSVTIDGASQTTPGLMSAGDKKKVDNMSSTINSAVSTHNTAADAHSDIRSLISGLTTRLNTLANSDDTTLDQMSEVVSYIKNNKSLIDGITTSKVNVSDIVNNLTTNSTTQVLSAAQGVAIKALIDALDSTLGSHNHDGRYYTEDEINTKISAINDSIATKQPNITGAASTVTGSNLTANRVIVANASGKIAVSDITTTKLGYLANATGDLQDQINSHINNKNNPHNVDKTDVGLGNVENKSSATIRGEITKQNVTDALGYTPPKTDTVYTHPTYTAKASGFYKITVDATGHVSAVAGVSKADIIGLGIPGTDTNTHYTTRIYAGASGTAANTAATSPYIKITDDDTYRNQIRLLGSGSVTVDSDANGNITISGTDTKNTAGSTNTISKLFLIGAMSQSNNRTTYSNSDVYIYNGTLTASKVYNAVWNDYAEYFERGSETEVGDIIALDLSSDEEKYVKATLTSIVCGVHSDTYGHIIGGKSVPEDFEGTFAEYNDKSFIPVGLKGRAKCKVYGNVKKGDLIFASDIPGVGYADCMRDISSPSFVGYALDNHTGDDIGLIKILLK